MTQQVLTQNKPYHELAGGQTLRLERLAGHLGVPLDEAADLALDFLEHEASQPVDFNARWAPPSAMDELTDMQSALLVALADGPLKGPELAKRAGYAEKSLQRGGVEPNGELRNSGLIRVTSRGYELTQSGRDVLQK